MGVISKQVSNNKILVSFQCQVKIWGVQAKKTPWCYCVIQVGDSLGRVVVVAGAGAESG